MLTILPFEEELYRGHGVRAAFVGHPLVDLVRESAAGFSPVVAGLYEQILHTLQAVRSPAAHHCTDYLRKYHLSVPFIFECNFISCSFNRGKRSRMPSTQSLSL